MTTIGADKQQSGRSSEEDGNSSRRKSVESIVLLDNRPSSLAKLGGIVKTTEVSTEINIARSRGRNMEEGLRPEQKALHMV